MKVVPVLGVTFAHMLAAQYVSASGLFVQFNQALASNSHAMNGTAALLDADGQLSQDPMVPVVLTATDSVSPFGLSLVANSPPSSVKTVVCSNTDSTPSAPNVKVLVVISTCFVDSERDQIEGWVASLSVQDSRYFQGGAVSKIDYVVQYVDSDCSAPITGKAAFDKQQTTTFIGVISFITDIKTCTAVNSYVNSKKIGNMIGFVKGSPVAFPGYNELSATDFPKSLSKISPYTVVRSLHCANLPDAIPTSYVDASGARQCFCSCQQGYEIKNNKCQKIDVSPCFCAWEQQTEFKFEVKAGEETKYTGPNGKCSIKNLALKDTSGLLPVPLTVDNYVAYNRNNDGDEEPEKEKARIELQKKKKAVTVSQDSTTKIEDGDPDGSTSYFTWKDFQTNGAVKIDALEFTNVGKYDVELKAKDYGTPEVACAACVTVVDSSRPTVNSAYPCPTSVNSVTTELTSTNILAVHNAVNAIETFKTEALNDPCSPNDRCDSDSLKLKTFAEASLGLAANNYGALSKFFSYNAVRDDLEAKLSPSPFAADTNELAATVQDVCTRCASLKTDLKEWWTPYDCTTAATAPIVAQCSGLNDGSATCALNQCISVNGNTVATAAAKLPEDVKSGSKNVVSKLNSDETTSDELLSSKYSLEDTVHVALECTKFQSPLTPGLLADEDNVLTSKEVCTYEKKVADLIQVKAEPFISAEAAASALFTNDEVKSFVSWRYQVDSGAWKILSDTTPAEEFAKSATVINVEAWTQCGKVAKFTFYVRLHLNNDITVCDHFNDMWYQTTVAPDLKSTNEFCLFSKSDFAELTFDYHPNIGLNFDTEKFKMSISRVQCTIMYDGLNKVTILDSESFAIPKSFQIVKQFAINALNYATTKASTTVKAACEFTYTRLPDTATVGQLCEQTFTIKDCTQPLIGKPCALDGKCNFNQCAVKKTGEPDLYQACGGSRITQGAGGATTLLEEEVKCCSSCDMQKFTTSCVPIGAFPTDATSRFPSVKRCEALKVGTEDMLVADPSTNMMAEEAQGGMIAGATTLVGVSALVALVALVVVQHRRRAVAVGKQSFDDTYYPLMG